MPREIGRTPHGVSILQDDGTVLFLPHEAQQAAADVSPTPVAAPQPRGARAVQQPDGTHLFLPDNVGGPPPVATSTPLPPAIDPDALRVEQSQSPVPDIAHTMIGQQPPASLIANPDAPGGAPGEIQMTPEDIAAGAVPLSSQERILALAHQKAAGGPVDPLTAAGGNPDDIEMGDDATPGMTPDEVAANDAAVANDLAPVPGANDAGAVAEPVSAPAEPGTAGPPAAQDPYERAGEEALAAGVMADNAAQEQAARQLARDTEVARIEGLKAEAQQRALARREELVTAYDASTQRQAEFDMRTPGKGVGAKIVDGIAIMLGALGQGLSGQNPADNPVMKQIDAEVERAAQDRARQYAKLATDTAGIANTIDQHDRLSTSQDAAFEAAKAVEWDKAARETERQAILLGGKEALQNAKVAKEMMLQKRDAAFQSAADKQADNEREDKKVAIDAFKANNQAIKDQQDAAVAAMNARTNSWQASISAKAQSQHASEFDKMEGQRAADLAKTYAETQKLLRDAETSGKGDPQMLRYLMDFQNKLMARGIPPIKHSKVVTAPDGTHRIEETVEHLMNLPDVMIDPMTGQPIAGPDGKPLLQAQEFLAPTEEEGQALRMKQAAVTTLVQTIDKIEAAVRKNGWSSDTLKSDEWREAQSLMAKAQLTVKDVEHLGVLAGPDMGLIEKYLGTSDPTEVRQDGLITGLRTSRTSAIDGFNNDLIGRGYTGTAKFDVPNANALPGGVLSAEGTAALAFAADKGSGRVFPSMGGGSPDLKNTDYLSTAQVNELINLHALTKTPGHETAALTALAKLAKDAPARGAVRTYLATQGIDISSVDPDLGAAINERAVIFNAPGNDDPAKRALLDSLGTEGLAKTAVAKTRPDLIANPALEAAEKAKKKQ